MSPLSQLFLRQRERLAGPGLWVNPPRDLPWRELGKPDCFTQDEADRRGLAAAGIPATFGAVPESAGGRQRCVLALPREKARLRLLAHCCADRLDEDGTLYLAGENRAGARSAPRQVEPWFPGLQKLDSARHCVLFAGRPAADLDPFDLENYRSEWSLEDPDLRIASYPGVFAHGGLDSGTELLLRTLEPVWRRAPERALDLGCGAGVIGATLAQRLPGLDLVMADSSALALAATRATLALNNLAATTVASDGLEGVTGPFDLVISNPPFHQGHREREDLGAGLFRDLGNFLTPGGQFIMVANRHLPWPRWMRDTLGACEVLAQTRTFHVLSYEHATTAQRRSRRVTTTRRST